MRVARPVVLGSGQRQTLESRARVRSASARSVERARRLCQGRHTQRDDQDNRIALHYEISLHHRLPTPNQITTFTSEI